MIRRELTRCASTTPVAIALWRRTINLRDGTQQVTIRLDGKYCYLNVNDTAMGWGDGMAFESEREARRWLQSELVNLSQQGFVETPCSLSRQEFLLGRGRTRRFWSIETDGLCRRIWYGRLGQYGQFRDRTFGSVEELQSSCHHLIRRRLREGYRRLNRRSFRWQ